jgi:hypothetical protein
MQDAPYESRYHDSQHDEGRNVQHVFPPHALSDQSIARREGPLRGGHFGTSSARLGRLLPAVDMMGAHRLVSTRSGPS